MQGYLFITLLVPGHFDKAILALAKNNIKISNPKLIGEPQPTSPASLMRVLVENDNISAYDNVAKFANDICLALSTNCIKFYSIVLTIGNYTHCFDANFSIEKVSKPKKHIPSYLKLVKPQEKPNDPQHSN